MLAGRKLLDQVTDHQILQQYVINKHAFANGRTLTRTKSAEICTLQCTKCFHPFECFNELEMGDICIIQLTCSRVNRSGFYCAVKSNVEPIYAMCQSELLCSLQYTSSLVFCFTAKEGSY